MAGSVAVDWGGCHRAPCLSLGSGGRDGRIARWEEDERIREGRGMVENDPLPKSTRCQAGHKRRREEIDGSRGSGTARPRSMKTRGEVDRSARAIGVGELVERYRDISCASSSTLAPLLAPSSLWRTSAWPLPRSVRSGRVHIGLSQRRTPSAASKSRP
jgi:hypothetical protein